MFGGVLWIVSWTCNAFTADGTRAVMGLSERGWRTLLNPVLLFFMAGLAGLYVKQAGRMGKAGLIIGEVGLMVTIVGNVVEFWVLGPADHRGWHLFLTGLVILGIGSLLFGLAALRAGRLPRLGIWLLLLWFPMVLLGLLSRTLGLPRFIATLGAGLGFVFFFVFFGLSWILLGYALWSEKKERHPGTVTAASPPQQQSSM